ncbi:zinc finger protein ZFPM1 isoform X2 [Cottoperca gobio]|uniref:Zinc finger protein ZFPM1 isoform X2 n=1 Tax=Cottoperca gobio TaxID=56716 RepID=A0A6J2PX63_COTGO|nr:zinc finger protein ZFPM1 isoform X2 [Cottoperca gobio]
MSRRKQSKPRQIKRLPTCQPWYQSSCRPPTLQSIRPCEHIENFYLAAITVRPQSPPDYDSGSLGDLGGDEENTPDNLSLSGEEGGASDPDDSAEGDSSSPPPYTSLYNEKPRTQDSRGGPDDEDEDGEEQGPTHSGEEEEGEEEEVLQWRGPDELELSEEGGDSRVVAGRDLHPDTTWGPYQGILQSEGSTDDQETENSRLTLVCEDPDCWISLLPLTSDISAANCTIYSQREDLFCKVSRELAAGERLLASLSPPPGSCSSSPQAQLSPPLSLVTQKQPVVKEESLYPPALLSDIQLLPQQAGMAAILATAIVNKDIFPCKDCGIWYRSERNLQAHLMYYCASRQKQPAAASSPPQDKPKESYPNERICPFPQCNKSCPSASSLEIHMRTHSGERPFVCLICLSAFTTKANCERHLKVHTDTLNGVCHGCGFVSTTRDILYSHLVTSHMVCQPGSHSEVYSPGPGLPKLPLSTGLSPGDSGVVLKCQVCGHNSDSPAQLQQHVRTHLEVRVPAERSPTPRQSTPSSVDNPQLQQSPQEREPLACVPTPDSSSPGANGGSATPRDYSPPDAPTTDLKIKEEPHSDLETEEQQMEIKEDGEEEELGGEAADQEARRKTKEKQTATSSFQTSTSPRSPTPGSSPAHVGGTGSVLPGGAMFLPQYMFNPEAAILPQASEILAKMSEMVHSRLKQGQTVPQNNPAAFFPSGPTAPTAAATPPHKGATCFECDITFNNINNFYAHKRLYCSSRHHGEGATSASGPGSTRDAAPATIPSSGAHGSSASPQGGAGSRAASASPSDSDPPAGSGATESGRMVEVKTETPVGKEGISSSSEGEGGGGSVGGGGGGRASEGSQSPASGSAEDQEDDPNRTFCGACNIRFSRHENYTVHKRFYCASRHDPSNHRSVHMAKATTAAAFLPQPIRTRKRKKMYEIHMARTEALANAAAAAAAAAASAAASAPSPSVLGLAVKQEVSPSGAGSSSPEGDGPIDLSKRPRLREAPRNSSNSILPSLPLTDYHKCTACSISFNSIENYLAHKTYYCPATTLQPQTLEQFHRLKRSASTSPKSRPQQERPDLLHPMEAKALPAEWVAQAQGTSSSPHPSSLQAADATSLHHTTTTLAAIPGAGAKVVGASASQVVCPYCPNRLITCDLMEHFKTTHGLVVTIQPPQPGSAVSRSPSLSPRDEAATTSTTPASQPRLVSRVHRDSSNGQARSGTTSPVSPLANGSPSAGDGSPLAGSPLSVSPSRAPSLTLSPVPEVLRETVGSSLLPDKAVPNTASHPDPTPQPAPIPGPKTTVISPVLNGNSRFCRLCNIKFSSLSTFIAHKKYYCSSHSAEHVK